MTTSIPEQAQNVSATATKKARVAQRRAHVAPAQAKVHLAKRNRGKKTP